MSDPLFEHAFQTINHRELNQEAVDSLTDLLAPGSSFRVYDQLRTGLRLQQFALITRNFMTAATEAVFSGVGQEYIEADNISLHLPQTLLSVLPSLEERFDDMTRKHAKEVFPRIAQAFAINTHLRMQLAFDEGLGTNTDECIEDIISKVEAEESTYLSFLSQSKTVASARSITQLNTLLINVAQHIHLDFINILKCSARIGPGDQLDRNHLSLRMSILGRRYSMLIAAIVMLHFRLRDRYSASSTQHIAQSRSELRRYDLNLKNALRRAGGAPAGIDVTVCGRVKDVEWIENPNKPFSRANFEDDSLKLYVPYKSMGGTGISNGAKVCARGEILRTAQNDPTLEVDFEGPGQHTNTVWEDWLAVLVRSSYDLHPGTMLLEWDFPPLSSTAASSDLYSRIS